MVVLQKRRNKELVELNKTRDKMISIISHDLKNPVLTQKITLEHLLAAFDGIDKEIIKEQCQLLLNNAEAQSDLVQNILTWALLHTGRLHYTPIRFDIASALNDSSKLFSLQLLNKELTLNCIVPQQAMAFADRNMFDTIVQNLLSNAIKFSNKNSEINIIAKEVTPSSYSISVQDYGVGMSDQQCSTVGTVGEKGSGLGLGLCRELLAFSKETLHIKSKKDEGTTISFLVKNGNIIES